MFCHYKHLACLPYIYSLVLTPPALASSSPYSIIASGGATSTAQEGRNAFSQAAANLSFEERLDFSVGNSFFRNPWVESPASTDARDGLGPLFNTNACQSCHIKDGRGHLPENSNDNAVSLLLRLSVDNKGRPDPVYGEQLQDFAISPILSEGQIHIEYESKQLEFNDGEKITLQRPVFSIRALNYGPLHDDVRLSPRIAPAMIGLGLLESISQEHILEWLNTPSLPAYISPKANWVMDKERKELRLGRFGWKAGQPSLRQQNAAAFAGDIGITSALFPHSNCTRAQQACLNAPHGGKPELSNHILDSVTFYTRHLAVPKRRNINEEDTKQGSLWFEQSGCQHCHRPSFTTATHNVPRALSEQFITPYTDLLLHDMGDELADNHVEGRASGREWRTPPLWGLGYLREVNGGYALLHDGRARNIEEAILWHGGEAETAQMAYRSLTKKQRKQLIAFLESL